MLIANTDPDVRRAAYEVLRRIDVAVEPRARIHCLEPLDDEALDPTPSRR